MAPIILETQRFEELLTRFSHTKVAVLGDFFLDLYIQLDRSLSEFSLETHKEAFQAIDLQGQPGAAGVVSNNLAAMGADSAAIGYTGSDGNGFTLRQALLKRNINTEFLVETPHRFTPTYTKPMMKELNGENIELNRIDIINRSPNTEELNLVLSKNLRQAVSIYDGVLVVEQVRMDGYGTLSPILRNTLSDIAKANPHKPIVVDSRHFAAKYYDVSLKMNLFESASALGNIINQFELKNKNEELPAAAQYAQSLWDIHQKPVFITLGANGICGIDNGDFFHIQGYPVSGPIDIVGAGDSVLAGIGLSLCAGAEPKEAAYIGNLVGSITVQQLGTTGIATLDDLIRRHHDYQDRFKK